MIAHGIRALFVVLCLSVSACGGESSGATAAAAAVPFAPTPDPDHFYDAPAVVPDVPGMVLNARSVSFKPTGFPEPNPAWQLQYVTHDAQGRAIAAIATVVKPLLPTVYGHPVLLSFQHAYDSLGASCTPSHTLQGNNSNSTTVAESLEYLPGLQTLGWTLVIADYEGPFHAFGAGPLSGQATLDAIRAALQFEPLGLSADTPVAMWGYSGGALATSWAAALQPRYAAALNLVGVVAGGTPVDMVHILRSTENSGDFSLLLSALFGMTRAYPALLPESLLTSLGRQAMSAQRDGCNGATTDGSPSPNGSLADYIAAPDPYQTPGFKSEAPKLTLLQSAQIPTANVYLFHERDDALVPIRDVDQLAAYWCQAGVPLSYYRSNSAVVFNNTPFGGHTAGAAIGVPAAYAYLASRFTGTELVVTPPGTVRCN